MKPEVRVRLEGPLLGTRKEELALSVGGASMRMSLRISSLSERLVATLPDVLHDLIDIAATVYLADCASTRGGQTDPGFGRDWRRSILVEVPVRCPRTWARDDVVSVLRETLEFLSEDFWSFNFRPREESGPTQGDFD